MELRLIDIRNMITIITIITICVIAPSTSLTYPVFGTKRYHRSGSGSTSRSLVNPIPVYAAPVQQQYYDEPNYPASVHEPDAEANYFYLPRSESLNYGLPTYRGEYKPKPFYYAHSPSYSYYDDRNEQLNPLDVLNEEMLQEDQRERQREMPGMGQERWVDTTRQDNKLTDAFLKNLILYNKQLNSHKAREYETANDFEEYEDPNAASATEYYEPIEPATSQTQRSQLYYEPYQVKPQPRQHQRGFDMRNFDNRHSNTDSSATSAEHSHDKDFEDKDVQELKSLANNNKLHKQQQKEQKKQRELVQRQRQLLLQQQEEQQRQLEEHERQQMLRQQILLQQQQGLNQPMYSDYPQDTPSEYDSEPEYDESWINWDKRNVLVVDRKPLEWANKYAILGITKPTAGTDFSTLPPPSSQPQQVVKGQNVGVFDGQKEVVLPRPATPVRHPFTGPVLDMLTHNAVSAQDIEDAQHSSDNGDIVHENNNNKSDASKTVSTGTTTVYDTIKQLLAMEKSLDKSSQESTKMQKRFVTNEEALVRELDGLKRVA